MDAVELSKTTLGRLLVLARAWDLDVDKTVARLIDEYVGPSIGTGDVASTPHEEPSHAGGWVSVYAVQAGQRIEGEFDTVSHRLRHTSGPLAGKTYRSPSTAASAVVAVLSPTVNPSRNGWVYWRVASNDLPLDSLRRT